MLHPQIAMDTSSSIQAQGFLRDDTRYQVAQTDVTLKNRDLWAQFHELQTEMIITKSGRRMFPALHCDISNLDPHAHYCIFLEMELAVSCRFKYQSSVGWSPAGNEEAQSQHRMYMHPESPSTGEQWMSQTVSFGRVKLTNTCSPPPGHIVLSSMHRYQPKILIVKSSNPASLGWAPTKCVMFPETQFIAVTAYQNDRITKLKIDHNPFAKGFRENGKSNTKRKQTSSAVEEEIDVVDLGSDGGSPKSQCLKQRSRSSTPEKVMSANKEKNYFLNVAPTPLYASPAFCFPPAHFAHYPPLWAPLPFFYQQPAKRQLSTHHEEKGADGEKPKKLTDFSIKAITGQS